MIVGDLLAKIGFVQKPDSDRNYNKFLGRMKGLKEKMAGTTDGISRFGGKISGVAKGIAGALTAIGTGLIGKRILDLEKIRRQFRYAFRGVEKDSKGVAKQIADNFRISFSKAQQVMTSQAASLAPLKGPLLLQMVDKSTKRIFDIMAKTGKSLKEVEVAFQAAQRGDLSSLAELLNWSKVKYEKESELMNEVSLASQTDAARKEAFTRRAISITSGMEGAFAQDYTKTTQFQFDRIKKQIVELTNAVSDGLTPAFRSSSKAIADFLSSINKSNVIPNFIKSMGNSLKVLKSINETLASMYGNFAKFTGEAIGEGALKAQRGIGGFFKKLFGGGAEDSISFADKFRASGGLTPAFSGGGGGNAKVNQINNIVINPTKGMNEMAVGEAVKKELDKRDKELLTDNQTFYRTN